MDACSRVKCWRAGRGASSPSASPAGRRLPSNRFSVCGSTERLMMLSGLVRRLRVEEVVFSGDALEPGQRQQVLRISAELGVPVRDWSSRLARRSSTLPGAASHDGRGVDRQLERRRPAEPVPGLAPAATARAGPRFCQGQQHRGSGRAPVRCAGPPQSGRLRGAWLARGASERRGT